MINKLLPSNTHASEFRQKIAIRPKEILSSNGKLKKDGIWNVTLPAFEGYYLNKGNLTRVQTCPSAGVCKSYCYAGVGGTYGFYASMIKHSRNLNYLMNDPFAFADQLVKEIQSKRNLRAIRFNDSGDVFSEGYWGVIKSVCNALPNTRFYAYTKRVQFFKAKTDIPPNFTIVFSQGGLEDNLIDHTHDRHARVFSSRAALRAAGYSDGTHTDRLACDPKYRKIGLVIHGNHFALPRLRTYAAKGSKTWEAKHV